MQKRLIEDYIPIREISAEASREKSIRKGHISTLHLWWARRPLVAARAAVYAALVPAPATPDERAQHEQEMIDLCRWQAGDDTIKKARARILAANNDTPPKVLDMFAGGGAIPLEALRLGCETYAVDLNPVAHLIQLCTLVYPQQYGAALADEVEQWGTWVLKHTKAEIGDLYVPVPDPDAPAQAWERPQQAEQQGMFATATQTHMADAPGTLTPVAYLWTRTVRCPNPGCAAMVPLVRQTWLAKKKNRFVALKMQTSEPPQVRFIVVEATTEAGLGFDPAGFSQRGNAVCPFCGSTVGTAYVKTEGKAGRIGVQPMAVVSTRAGRQGKVYQSTDTLDPALLPDDAAIQQRIAALCEETGLTVPDEPLPPYGTLGFRIQPYGMQSWGDLFTPRQLLALLTFCKWVRKAHDELTSQNYTDEQAKIISTYLGVMVSRLAGFCSSVCVWNYTGGRGTVHAFGRQALPMVWDFAETNPFNDTGANWQACIDAAVSTIRNLPETVPAIVERTSAARLTIESASLDAIITDPPYYDNVPYAHLSDFFYVWLKRSIGHLYQEHLSNDLTPKKQEAIAEPARFGGSQQQAQTYYEQAMQQVFSEANRMLKPGAPMVVVYAHKTTAGWATLVDALRVAGFVLTEAWPVDTERPGRLREQNSAALASSIFIVARKREGAPVGNYATQVRPHLYEVVRERVATLHSAGVGGADLVIACVGAGLRAYTQFARVELPNGEELAAATFLDEVQRAVMEVILTDVIGLAESGVNTVDKASQYYILARFQYGMAVIDFDEANVLARGVGIELDGPGALTSGSAPLVKKSKTRVEWNDYRARGGAEKLGLPDNGNMPPLIDVLHRLLWLNEQQPSKVAQFLGDAHPDTDRLRMVAEALGGKGLSSEPAPGTMQDERTEEQKAIGRLLPAWRRVVEEPVKGKLL